MCFFLFFVFFFLFHSWPLIISTYLVDRLDFISDCVLILRVSHALGHRNPVYISFYPQSNKCIRSTILIRKWKKKRTHLKFGCALRTKFSISIHKTREQPIEQKCALVRNTHKQACARAYAHAMWFKLMTGRYKHFKDMSFKSVFIHGKSIYCFYSVVKEKPTDGCSYWQLNGFNRLQRPTIWYFVIEIHFE